MSSHDRSDRLGSADTTDSAGESVDGSETLAPSANRSPDSKRLGSLLVVALPERGQKLERLRLAEPSLLECEDSPSASRLTQVYVCFQVATVVAWLVLSLWFAFASHSVGFYFFFSLTTFHAATLGLWLGVGRVWWRWLTIPVATMMLVVGSSRPPSPAFWEYSFYCSGIVGSIAAPIFLLRLSGLQVFNVNTGESACTPLRFGIRHLILWTCGTAILLGIFRLLVPQIDIVEIWRDSREIVLLIFKLIAAACIPALLGLWTWLGQRLSVFKLCLWSLVTGLAAYLVYEPEYSIFSVAILISHAGLTLLLLLHRGRGIRFIKLDKLRDQ